MRFRVVPALVAVAVSAGVSVVAAPSAAAAEWNLLAEASGHGITARLWLNEHTRQLHAEGVNMPRLSTVRLDGADLSQASPHDGATVRTGGHNWHPHDYRACAGFISETVCTKWHRHNG